jgi:hypothetical protein
MKRTSLCLLALVSATTLAACGSSSTTSGGAAASSRSGAKSSRAPAGSANRTKLFACLKAHGVTPPARPGGGTPGGPGGYGGGGPGVFGGGGGGGGAPGSGPNRPGFRSNPKFQAAVKACGGGGFPSRRAGGTPQRAAIESFVTCVRKHGYTLPQPNFSGHGAIFPAKIAADAKFRAASKSCVSLLRPPGAPSGSAPGPGSSAAAGGGGAPST